MIEKMLKFPRAAKVGLIFLADAVSILAAFCLAALLTGGADGLFAAPVLQGWMGPALLSLVLLPLSFFANRMYMHMVRYAGLTLVLEVVKGCILGFMVLGLIDQIVLGRNLDWAFVALAGGLTILGAAGARLAARGLIERLARGTHDPGARIIIYGAGVGGVAIFNGFRDHGMGCIVAFADNDPKLAGRKIHGVTVYPADRLEDVIRKHAATQIILAIPSLSRKRRVEILRTLEQYNLRVRILPGIGDLMDGRINLADVRDIRAEDLLWRKTHTVRPALLKADSAGKSILVTGAGGSIGSELCRQALKQGPARLLAVDQSEYNLYALEQSLAQEDARYEQDTEVKFILSDVAEQQQAERLFRSKPIDTVYHAAAYKHVPLIEYNTCEGVRNNVWGTLHTARAAMAAGVEKFVLVSTDKAVRPTNVMGASKRLSEMILQALQQEDTRTRFTMVRFGNVLDSAGSVVPLFREQIARGGPLTLTHKDVTRYFMTIPEAAQLVLQAGAMAEGGEVYLLDMGEPVKIYDLARRMIRLSGLELKDPDHPGGDIEIRITGMRPGEKLHEELFLTEDIEGTAHGSVMRAKEDFIPWAGLEKSLAVLDRAVTAADEAAVRKGLAELVEGFSAAPPERDAGRDSRLRLVE